jgi:hypothetical protein
MHTDLRSQVKGFQCLKGKRVESPDEKWPKLVWPVPRPGHPAAGRTSPAGPPDQCTGSVFGVAPDQPGRAAGLPAMGPVPPDLPPGHPAQGPAPPDLSPEKLLCTPPTARFPPTYKYPFSHLGLVRSSPTIVHL